MDDVLADLADAPKEPEREACEQLLAELARLCAAGGWERFARPAVVPGEDAFPDAWEPTPLGVATIARRLLDHAGVDDLAIVIADRRDEAGPSGKKVPTAIELVSVDGGRARLDLYSIGEDDVVGTVAHEVAAAAVAARWQEADAPYRGVAAHMIDRDARWRGSIAAVYCGLGVLAANAAFQEYKLGRYRAHLGYAPVEYEVLEAGHLTIDELGFLLAVQAVVQDARAAPRGLGGVQLDVVRAWIDALAGRGPALRALLGVPARDTWPDLARGAPPPLPDVPADALVIATSTPRARRVFRMPQNRAGIGVLAGMIAVGVAAGIAGGGRRTIPIAIVGGALAGAVIGSRSRLERCSGCIHVLPSGAAACPHCGGEIAGLLTSRADALDAD